MLRIFNLNIKIVVQLFIIVPTTSRELLKPTFRGNIILINGSVLFLPVKGTFKTKKAFIFRLKNLALTY